LAQIVRSSIDITTVANPRSAEGKAISITDRITSNSTLGDNGFLKAAAYIVVDRLVEKYTRYEKTTEDSSGRKTTHYEGLWTSTSPLFPGNPFYTVSSAQMGGYRLDMRQFKAIRYDNRRLSCGPGSINTLMGGSDSSSIINLPINRDLTLTAENTQIPVDPNWAHTERLPQYIFQGMGSTSSPAYGDLRTCYAVLPSNTLVTIFGRIEQNRLVPYPDRDRQVLRIIPGSRSVALDLLSQEYRSEKWGARVGGFMLSLFGLSFICIPGAMYPKQIPGLRWVPNNSLLFLVFPAAVVHSIINVVTAFIFHSPIPAIVIILGLWIYVANRYRRYL
jgi:Transmembrane protein 43